MWSSKNRIKNRRKLPFIGGFLFALALYSVFETIANWDGTTPSSQPSTFRVSGSIYYIDDEKALAWFAKTVTNGTTYSGKTVRLTADLNMDNKTFDGIGTSGKQFAGTFDGQNHTIQKVKISRSGTLQAGLFNELTSGATIQNLKLSTISTSTATTAARYHAALVSIIVSGSATTTISNITINGATVTGSA